MPPNTTGGSAAERAMIRSEITEMLDRLQPQITDIDLQACIRRRANGDDGVILGGEFCYTYRLGFHEEWQWGPFKVKSDHIHICPNSISRHRTNPSATLMHE